MAPRLTRGGHARPMTVPESSLGLSFYFETGAIAGDEAVGQLLAGTAAAIRRYLDDPVNAQVVGRRPDPRRNAFLSLLLAIDRAGFEPGSLSVLPLEPVCRPAAHAGLLPHFLERGAA